MATKRASAKMPPLKHALVLAAEVETLKVQVEALRGVLSELASNTECLLRDANPMTPSAKVVERLCRRSAGILNTYASERVRDYFEGLERDKVLLDFIERDVTRLVCDGERWAIATRDGRSSCHLRGPLRQVLWTSTTEEVPPW